MDVLIDKFKEVITSVIPIVIMVGILSIFLVDVSGDMFARFIIGAILLVIGLTIFLLGIDVGMEPMGVLMGNSVAHSQSHFYVAIISFIIGFAVTIAEPDMLVLAQQIANATNGALPTQLVVLIVSVGVGLLVAVGVYRILLGIPIKYMFLILYGIVFVLCLFASNDFIAMAFDASGSSTGSLTTPFILALGASISARKGGKKAEDDSFGLTGIMSVGPIIAVLLMSIITQTEFQGTPEAYVYTEGIFAPFFFALTDTLIESFIALLPIFVIFLIMNKTNFNLSRREFSDIVKGTIYAILGLTIFLTGINEGFMDMGRYLGSELAANYVNWLPIIGFIMGMVIVLAEPAVVSLGDQVEEVTGGHVKNSLLLIALCLGVGLAVSLSMVRIIVPGLELWHFLLPGFGFSILLAFIVPDLFTGISFDAGGVASGPMAATFILPFSQGVADFLPQANLITDGFGVIAMVSVIPVLMVQLLGLYYKFQTQKMPN